MSRLIILSLISLWIDEYFCCLISLLLFLFGLLKFSHFQIQTINSLRGSNIFVKAANAKLPYISTKRTSDVE